MKLAAAWAVRVMLVLLIPVWFVGRAPVDIVLALDEWAAATIDARRFPVEN